MKEIVREVQAPMDAVLDALRDDSREWRESVIPPELRKRGVVRMECRLKPPFFRLRFRKVDREQPQSAELRAVVVATPGGGCRIRGEAGHRSGLRVAIVILALVVGAFVVAGNLDGAIAVLVMGTVTTALMLLVRLAARGRPDPETDYLLQRLETAIAAAEKAALATRSGRSGAPLPLSRPASP